MSRRALGGMLLVSATALAQSPPPASVAPAPTESVTAAPPVLAAGGFYIYPRNGQSQGQQASDRYQCHSWAVQQTGFDPTRAAGDVAPEEELSRRSAYRRAISACLEARGYRVTDAAPASAPPLYGPPGTPVRLEPVVPPPPALRHKALSMQIEAGYPLTVGNTDQMLEGDFHGGLGLSWFPMASLPLGLRVDGAYDWFRDRGTLLNRYGSIFNSGHQETYGGDLDLQLDLPHRSARWKLYLLGGVGWYRVHSVEHQLTWQNGTVCGWYFCGPGSFPVFTAEQSGTSPWEHSWNGGLGWEIALSSWSSFFVEARYERILPDRLHLQYVPIEFGLRL